MLAVERFSSANLSWATVMQLSGPRERHGSNASATALLLAGGIDTTNGALTTLNTADFVDASANTVTSYTMAHGRNGCAVTALASGTYLVTGGFEGATTSPIGLDGTSVGLAETFTNVTATGAIRNCCSPWPPVAKSGCSASDSIAMWSFPRFSTRTATS